MARYFILSGETAAGELFAEPGSDLAKFKARVNAIRAAGGDDGKRRLRRLQLMDDAGNRLVDVAFNSPSASELKVAEAKAKAEAEANAKAEQRKKEAAELAEKQQKGEK